MKTLLQKTITDIDLEKLLTLSEKDLEKALSSLKYHEMYEIVSNAPWEAKAKLILYSQYPEGLVKNLPPQELFLTIKASSLDLAVELLSYAKGSQIQFMFDIDCWYKDRIKPERVASWLVLLFETGEDKVLEWLRIADFDFLVAVFQKFIKVYKRPDDVDLLEAMDYLPSFTLDDYYFIDFKNEALEFYFRRIIEILRSEIPEMYFALLESVIWEIPAEVEERAYRWRNGRLADEGIPEYFEALDVYTILHPKALRKVDIYFLPPKEEETDFSPVNIMTYRGEEELFVFKVLEKIESLEQLNRIKKELAWLANKVIVVDHVVIDEINQVKKSLDKVWGGLNIGLEYLSGENLEIAKKFVEEHFLEDIFRVSQTVLRNLRKFAISLTRSSEFDSAVLRYLDQPYKGYLEGILVKNLNQIRFFDVNKIGTDEEYRNFRRLKEVDLVRRYVEEVGYMAPLIQKMFGSPLSWITEVNKPMRNFDVNFLTWTVLILTGMFQWIIHGEFKFKAVPQSRWKEVLNKVFTKKGEINMVKEEIKDILFKSFESFSKKEWYLEKDLLSSFLNFTLNKLETEFKYADLEDPQDPKYQTLILIDLGS